MLENAIARGFRRIACGFWGVVGRAPSLSRNMITVGFIGRSWIDELRKMPYTTTVLSQRTRVLFSMTMRRRNNDRKCYYAGFSEDSLRFLGI